MDYRSINKKLEDLKKEQKEFESKQDQEMAELNTAQTQEQDNVFGEYEKAKLFLEIDQATEMQELTAKHEFELSALKAKQKAARDKLEHEAQQKQTELNLIHEDAIDMLQKTQERATAGFRARMVSKIKKLYEEYERGTKEVEEAIENFKKDFKF